MGNYIDKLNTLDSWSVWVFTKQSISFDTAFKAVKLLAEMPNRENGNVEEYFAENHKKYGIETKRHRVLVISQLFGLLTKTPLYKRGGRYNTEQPTEIFEKLNELPFGSKEYNIIKTEQILKIKIKAIIDTADNNNDWDILPSIFSYKVLKQLKEQYNMSSISLDRFYTYVMTCSDYKDADSAVEFIRQNCPISNFVTEYKDRSRFLTLFQNNFSLFTIDNDSISINPKFDNYFNDMFMERFDIDELNIQLSRDVDYTYFLTTYQDFGINLIDDPNYNKDSNYTSNTVKQKKKKVIITDCGDVEDDDIDYVNNVNEVKEFNINKDIAFGADKVKPVIKSGSIAKRYSKNPIIGKIAIQNAHYKCENNEIHSTFTSNTTKKPFMEAHHLIPISYQDKIWNKYNVNIDCVENIVSLCPNCHRAIHYATNEEKTKLIKKLYDKKKIALKTIGINLAFEDILKLYLK